MSRKIAVIGALTNFGRSVLDYLADTDWPDKNIYALDRRVLKNLQIPYNNTFLPVLDIDSFDFNQVKLCFLCLSTFLSEDRENILKSGAYLIDCSGILENAPCVVASVNLKEHIKDRVILNPTALTIALTKILSPIHHQFKIINAEATILLSTGLFGSLAIRDLVDQSRCLFTREEPKMNFFPKIQAFNLIPEISPGLNRQTAEQVKSLLHFPIAISSCLTPVFQGECYSITFTTKSKTSLDKIKQISSNTCQIDNTFSPDLGLTTQDILFANSFFISRLNPLPFRPNTYHLWGLGDSLRTGAVFNAVQIAKDLL